MDGQPALNPRPPPRGIATELVLVAAIIYLPSLQMIFGTAAFPLANWLFLLAWLPALPLMDEVWKALLGRLPSRRAVPTA